MDSRSRACDRMGALVQTSAGQATGPVGFLRVYDHAFGEIAQGGTRRGANMAVLRVDHPDVEDFISFQDERKSDYEFQYLCGDHRRVHAGGEGRWGMGIALP